MRPYRPTERLHAALAAFLRDAGTSDPDGLAYAALQWFHDRPDLERVGMSSLGIAHRSRSSMRCAAWSVAGTWRWRRSTSRRW